MHAATGVSHLGSNNGNVGVGMDTVIDAALLEPLPAPSMRDTGKADTPYDQLMKEAQAQARRPAVVAHPYFVAGKITRDTAEWLCNGVGSFGRYVAGGMSSVGKALRIGPPGAQALETARNDAATPTDQGTMHWELDELTPKAFWAQAQAQGVNRDWLKKRAIVFVEPDHDSRAALHLAHELRWDSNDPILDRSDEQVLNNPALRGLKACIKSSGEPGVEYCNEAADGAEPGKRGEQLAKLVQALNAGIKTIGSFVHRDAAWGREWEQAFKAMHKPTVGILMAVFGEKIALFNKLCEIEESMAIGGISQGDVESLQAARQNVVREAEELARMDRETSLDLPRHIWQQMDMLKTARIKAGRTDFLVLGPEAGRRFILNNPDKEVLTVTLARAGQSRQALKNAPQAMTVPHLAKMRIVDSGKATAPSPHPRSADAATETAGAPTCDAGGNCDKTHGLRWELDALTPGAFWARASAQGMGRDWFDGKAIVFIEPGRASSAAQNMAAALRWKEGDPILIMLDQWSIDEAKKEGIDACGTRDDVPGKACIGIADPAIVKPRGEQIVRVVEALKTGIKTLARVLPQDEAWLQRHRAVDKNSADALAALFGSQMEAVNKMLETHRIRREDAALLIKARSDIVREMEALDRLNRETFPGMIEYAWKQLEMHGASRAGTGRTDFVVLGPDAGRRFIAENRHEDVVIVKLVGGQQDEQEEESLAQAGVPSFGEMRLV